MDGQGHISPAEAREALRALYRGDPETNLQKAFLASLADELRPIGEKGRWKPSPLLILALVVACALAGVFLYFSIGGRS